MYDPRRGYPTAVPYVLYRDPAAAARWITEVLSFREAIRFTIPNGGPVGHIELERHGAVLTLGLAGSRFGETASITLVFVEDVDAACTRIPRRRRDHSRRAHRPCLGAPPGCRGGSRGPALGTHPASA